MSSARVALVLLLGWGVAAVHAAPLSDPTRPWADHAPSQGAGRSVSRAPVLSSIMIAPRRRVAVINGEVVREGDRIGSLRVIAIEAGSVRLHGPRGYSTLKLLPVPVKRAVGKATE